VCWERAAGTLLVLVMVQLSVVGLYLLPLFKYPLTASPPQTIISLPVHTAVCACRPTGALTVLVAAQTSAHVPSHFEAVVILGRM
jgi:hypothetical protein